MSKYIVVFVLIVIAIFAIGFLMKNGGSFSKEFTEAGSSLSTAPETKPITNNSPDIKIMSATLNTSKGSIAIEFFDKEAPKTVANFIKLAQEGFYNGVKFHRIIKGFMIQTGDPLSKDDSKMIMWGQGGPGYQFADEINAKSSLYTGDYKKGIVAMANSGPNTNGSQFFIMTEDYPLPPLYTIFGKVTSGQDVVDKIAAVKTNAGDRPINPVVIQSISLK